MDRPVTTKAKRRKYEVYVEVLVETIVPVLAESYEDALVQARELGVKDVVEFDTDFNDGSIRVVGVYNRKEPLP